MRTDPAVGCYSFGGLINRYHGRHASDQVSAVRRRKLNGLPRMRSFALVMNMTRMHNYGLHVDVTGQCKV